MTDEDREIVDLWANDEEKPMKNSAKTKKSTGAKKNAGTGKAKASKAERIKERKQARAVFFLIVAALGIAALLQAVVLPLVNISSGNKLMKEGKYEEAIAKFDRAGSFYRAADKKAKAQEASYERNYQNALAAFEAGKYAEAKEAFRKLNGYKDSPEYMKKCDYVLAENLLAEGDFDAAKAAFEAISDFSDSAERMKECDFAKANKLASVGYYQAAWELIEPLADYEAGKEFRARIQALAEREIILNAEVGAKVIFGRYEQDGLPETADESIVWIVLDKDEEEGRILLVAEYVLDCRVYNTLNAVNNSYYAVTWEKSDLRSWMNTSFMDAAFSADEKALISTVTLSTAKNPNSGVSGGNATEDRVFILSFDAARTYFSDDTARIASATPYAAANGVYVNSYTDSCYWWLRNPGGFDYYACFVDYDGLVQTERGLSCGYVNCGVRPALWISMN